MVRFKRGSTFQFAGPVTVNGVVQDMTGWAITSQLRRLDQDAPTDAQVGELIADIPATFTDPVTAMMVLGNTQDTSAWPLGPAIIDMVFTASGGNKIITNSVEILIVERATQP